MVFIWRYDTVQIPCRTSLVLVCNNKYNKILSGEARECRATGILSGVWPEHSSILFDFFKVARGVAVCVYRHMYCRSTEVCFVIECLKLNLYSCTVNVC